VCVDAKLATARLVKEILGMPGIDEARLAGFDVPNDGQAYRESVEIWARASDPGIHLFSKKLVISNADACSNCCRSRSEPSEHSRPCRCMPEEVAVVPSEIRKADRDVAPVAPARSCLVSVVPPTIDDAASICVRAFAQFERANVSLQALSTPAKTILIQADRSGYKSDGHYQSAERPGERAENPSPHACIRHRQLRGGRLPTLAPIVMSL